MARFLKAISFKDRETLRYKFGKVRKAKDVQDSSCINWKTTIIAAKRKTELRIFN